VFAVDTRGIISFEFGPYLTWDDSLGTNLNDFD